MIGKLKERAKGPKRDIPAVMMALRDRRTPWYAKALAAITVCYALSPIDLIPDFIPVLGMLDDIILLPALIALTVRLIPREVFEECREACTDKRAGKRWYCAVPFVMIWAAVILLIVKVVFL